MSAQSLGQPCSEPAGHGRGVLTLAHGKRRYLRMARVLGETLRLHCPDLPRAIITDASDPYLRDLYPIQIPFDPSFGSGLRQKLYLDRYSPFAETLFIDADSMVVRDLQPIWNIFADTAFGVIGKQMREGYWFGDIARLCSQFGVESIPRFNGGLLYFDRSAQAAAVFEEARAIMDRYEALGFAPLLRGGRNDEPVLAFALALHGIRALDDGGSTMRTLIGRRGPLEIDVLRGICRFNKEGVDVTPAIAHFCGWDSRGFHYRRECLKLALAAHLPFSSAGVAGMVDRLCNPPHALFEALGAPLLARAIRLYKGRKLKRIPLHGPV